MGSIDEEKRQSMSPDFKEGSRPPAHMMESIESARQKMLSPIAENVDGEVRLGSNPATPKLAQ